MASGYVSTSSDRLPVVPLRDMVVFPQMMAPFIVGRRGSVLALEQTLRTAGKLIFLVAQRDPKVDDPGIDDIHRIGVVARVVQNVKLPNGNVKVMVEGLRRAELRTLEEIDGAFEAEVEVYEIHYPADDKVQVYMSRLLNSFEQYAKMSHHLAFESLMSTLKLDDPDRFADALAAHLTVSTAEKQTLLETLNPYERLQAVHDLLDVEVEKINIDKRINVQVKKQMEKAQKEYYLNEKIKAIHHELGRKDERGDEVAELKEKIEKSGAPKLVREKAEQELRRLEAMPPVSAEATVSRNYVDWLVSVPWKKRSRELKDLKKAARILDEGHYGLEKVKERVLEFLAVRQLTHKNQNSIICFVGPPGVGKSSLAKSIAAATGRKFVRLSLGGVRDEAEIRGHRRTYIGAFPGQIIQMMKRAGTVNPVFLLDEVDKMSMDFRGDPSSALLEVLDPEQNDTFVDHYMDIEYDLSKVMFIATANVEHPIPPALKDRMEIIQLAGYTPNEKLEIARQFLVPRQLDSHGLTEDAIRFGEDSLGHLMDSYTREAGVRNLEREIAAVCRKLARRLVEGGRAKKVKAKAKAKGKGASKDAEPAIAVDRELVGELLGKPKFRPYKKLDESEVGVATGLAWTQAGGELLQSEVGLMKGSGKLILTGKLGDVMKESARAAMSYLRSRADGFGLEPGFHADQDLHIHVPEGAIPKDGPSAGITMASALISSLLRVPVRGDVAMTGEITLRGKVLPVGGIKDKVLAAYRAGIFEILLPKENDKDLEEVPEEVRDKMKFHLVESMDEVLEIAFDGVVQRAPEVAAEFQKPASEAPPANVAH
ncbi:MAG: endopeptidase La [Holophagales bacterium]|nr:endopeptidase La [Holophagales bacterium]MYF97147.1 endopeptidase La [Holophagales bacterium]